MANLTETTAYDAGVYQIETTDPVTGGAAGIANKAAINLANRTKYLKSRVDLLEAGTTIPPTLAALASPTFTGDPKAPTAGLGDNDTSLATTAFVQSTVGGRLAKSVAGGGNVTLTAVEAGNAILEFTGALTANIEVIVPTSPTRTWLVTNSTTGGYVLTIKTASGTGVATVYGDTATVWTNGTNVLAVNPSAIKSINGGQLAGLRNRIINGACNIAQRGSITLSSTSIEFGGPDMFSASIANSPGGSFAQSAATLTFGSAVKNTVRQTVVSSIVNTTSDNYWHGIMQTIEGSNCYDLSRSSIAVSFIFRATVGGAYSFSLRGIVLGIYVSYVSSFTVAANTATKVTILVPPGSFDIANSNGVGLSLCVGFLNTGIYQTATLNTWQNGNYVSATGAVNWGATPGNFIELTELQLEKGPVATEFEHRPYGMEMALCQRYYETVSMAWGSQTPMYAQVFFRVTKRVAPTYYIYAGSLPAGAIIGGGGDPCNSFRLDSPATGPSVDACVGVASNL